MGRWCHHTHIYLHAFLQILQQFMSTLLKIQTVQAIIQFYTLFLIIRTVTWPGHDGKVYGPPYPQHFWVSFVCDVHARLLSLLHTFLCLKEINMITNS